MTKKEKGYFGMFIMEAASGFEPLHKGFADLSLATWVRRRNCSEK
jgi:hypothetical protein